MIIEQGRMTYDESDDRCICILKRSVGQTFAFIQCVDDDTQNIKRFFGPFQHEFRTESITEIMKLGATWPAHPE